jgi:hypothetical protein
MRDTCANLCWQPRRLAQLLEIFNMCEDLEDTPNLETIFRLMKGLVLLGESSLYEVMFADDTMVDVIGVFEYVLFHNFPTTHSLTQTNVQAHAHAKTCKHVRLIHTNKIRSTAFCMMFSRNARSRSRFSPRANVPQPTG